MKKQVWFLSLFLLPVIVLYSADDNGNGYSRPASLFDVGAGYTYTSNPELKGGHLELGLGLYNKRNFYVRSRIVMRASRIDIDDADGTLYTLSEKLVFGRGDVESSFYNYVEGGAGLLVNSEAACFNCNWDNLIYSFGFGGGLVLGGIYAEIGYLGQKITSEWPLSGIVFQTGWRVAF